MATEFREIYSRAWSKIKDKKLLNNFAQLREELMFEYLLSAESDFMRICKHDLSKKLNDSYEEDLDYDEIEILGLGIVYYWGIQQVMNADNFKNNMNTKEYSWHSSANLLREATEAINTTIQPLYRAKLREYDYRQGDIETWAK